MDDARPTRRLWTVWLEHTPAGEGRTLLARIALAADERDALRGFKERFSSFQACEVNVEQGVIENSVTKALFPIHTLDHVRLLEGSAPVDLFGHFCFGRLPQLDDNSDPTAS